jgi:hypothetical protein
MEIPMFAGTVTPVVHVHDPAGILIVSPFAAAVIAACTSLALQEAAVRVAAGRGSIKNMLAKRATKKGLLAIVIWGCFLYERQ